MSLENEAATLGQELEACPAAGIQHLEDSDPPALTPETSSATLNLAEQVLQAMLQSIQLDNSKLQEKPGDHARLINACARLVDSATRLAIARGAANPGAPGASGCGPTLQQLQQIQLTLNLL